MAIANAVECYAASEDDCNLVTCVRTWIGQLTWKHRNVGSSRHSRERALLSGENREAQFIWPLPLVAGGRACTSMYFAAFVNPLQQKVGMGASAIA
jgi:hypothetical protein